MNRLRTDFEARVKDQAERLVRLDELVAMLSTRLAVARPEETKLDQLRDRLKRRFPDVLERSDPAEDWLLRPSDPDLRKLWQDEARASRDGRAPAYAKARATTQEARTRLEAIYDQMGRHGALQPPALEPLPDPADLESRFEKIRRETDALSSLLNDRYRALADDLEQQLQRLDRGP